MRICIIAPMFPPLKSGSSHYAYHLSKGLASRGHDVYVLTSSDADVEDAPFTIVRIPSVMLPSTPFTHNYSLPFNFLPLNYPLIKSLLSQIKPDVVHINGHFLDLSISSAFAAAKLKIPSSVTIHTRLVHANQYLNPFIRALDRSLVSKVVRSCNAVIALDRQMHHYIRESYELPLKRIHVIPLAINVDELLAQPDLPNVLDEIGSSRIIASLTHITALKSPLTLLRAFSKIKHQVPDVKILFIGSVHDTRVLDWVKDLELENDVIFMGAVDHKKIPTILRASVLEAHSLDFRTGFDNASVEAMALGLPVISCVREDNFMRPWLHNWENVVLVKPRDDSMVAQALLRLLTETETRETVKQNAKQTGSKYFSLDRMLDDIEMMFKQIVGV